jgi:hypothetical protein
MKRLDLQVGHAADRSLERLERRWVLLDEKASDTWVLAGLREAVSNLAELVDRDDERRVLEGLAIRLPWPENPST